MTNWRPGRGERQLYRLAKQRDRTGRDVQQVRVIKDADGNVLTRTEAVLGRWKEYFERLMNEENGRKRRTEETAKVWEQVEEISEDEVLTALKKMQGEKAVGPDHLPAEIKQYSKVNFRSKDNIWNADLITVSKPENSYKYILAVIDGYIRYAWAVPLKDRKGETVANAFKEIMKKMKTENIKIPCLALKKIR